MKQTLDEYKSGLSDKEGLLNQIEDMKLDHAKEVDKLKNDILAMKWKHYIDLEKVQTKLREEINNNW